MILAVIFLNEGLNEKKIIAMVLIGVGTMLMITRKKSSGTKSRAWLIYALLSAVFASLTSILAKVGIGWCEFQSWNGISYWSGTCYGMGGSICNKETETGPEYDLPGWNVSDFIRNSNRSILALLLPGAAAGRSQRSGAD